MIKCQHCGRNIPYDANLCPYCGRSIKSFQQKEVLETEDEQKDQVEVNEGQGDILPRPPKSGNDRKMLFFIIAVLALLLIIGGIYHYSSMPSSDDGDAKSSAADTSAIVDTTADVAVDGKKGVGYNPKRQQQVVVNGEGVRMRFGPSLKAGYLKDEHGATRSVKKGTRLECVGQEGDWYQVVYMGKRYYMSKQFTYLVE